MHIDVKKCNMAGGAGNEWGRAGCPGKNMAQVENGGAIAACQPVGAAVWHPLMMLRCLGRFSDVLRLQGPLVLVLCSSCRQGQKIRGCIKSRQA